MSCRGCWWEKSKGSDEIGAYSLYLINFDLRSQLERKRSNIRYKVLAKNDYCKGVMSQKLQKTQLEYLHLVKHFWTFILGKNILKSSNIIMFGTYRKLTQETITPHQLETVPALVKIIIIIFFIVKIERM